jgi:hypothetical protein
MDLKGRSASIDAGQDLHRGIRPFERSLRRRSFMPSYRGSARSQLRDRR